jgi:hypothetical protein
LKRRLCSSFSAHVSRLLDHELGGRKANIVAVMSPV